MPLNSVTLRILAVCIVFCFTVTLLIGVLPTSLEQCNCQSYESLNSYIEESAHRTARSIVQRARGTHRLAILVPFRERFEELLEFAPHMDKFLTRQGVDHHIFILNQIDRYRFNRASLINIGFIYAKKDFDYIAMHDVDLLPLNDNLKYDYPEHGPLHIASPKFHPKYHYDTFVGGILLVKREHFQKMNGMSNKYWGWGLEDDEFYVRIKDAGLSVSRPHNITTGTENTFSHIHDRSYRKRDTAKCYNQKEVTRKRDRETGLNTIKYKIDSVKRLSIDDTYLTLLNIRLECDTKLTPWCNCTGTSK